MLYRDLGDKTHHKLNGEDELRTGRGVDRLVKLKLGRCRAIPGDLAGEVSSGIGMLERIKQRGCLRWSLLQLDSGGQLHSHSIA